ncbi:MAG: MBL fold metallo-hydrolase [Patescibacteria group bacterium]
MFQNKYKNYYFALFGLFLATIFLWQEVGKFSDNNLKVYFFNVGQGDAAYIRTPDQQDILIDGGPDATILSKLGEVMPFFDRKIELIILSHPQADHMSGLIDVIDRYDIGKIIWTKVQCQTGICQEWRRKISEKNISQEKTIAGEVINFGKINIIFFHPNEDFENKKIKDLNASTIVAQLVYQNNSFLFTGDIDQGIEKTLTANFILKSDVLKVPHHGSKYSSSLIFLKGVDPQYAVIPVGKNSYGHPAPQTLQNLKNSKIKTFRTDQDGDIKCEADGKNINCQKK